MALWSGLGVAVAVGWGFTSAAHIGTHQGDPAGAAGNLATVAKATTSFVSGHETLGALNDGFDPRNSNDKSRGAYGNWPRRGTQWVQYEWPLPISTSRSSVYWFDDAQGVRLPKACRLLYWDGTGFVPMKNAIGLGTQSERFNVTTFDTVKTTKIRLEFDGVGEFSTGILDWRVFDDGASPNFAPTVSSGPDRVVVLGGKTYLEGQARDDAKPQGKLRISWSVAQGPGKAVFSHPTSTMTTAEFSHTGKYVIRFSATDGQLTASSDVRVTVEPMPSMRPLREVDTAPYRLDQPFWRERIKALIVNWIPHCIRQMEDPAVREGGIQNFESAGRRLRGLSHERHQGAVFANAWVYNTVESMCLAQMVDAQGDPEMLAAQANMMKTLDAWIPKILSAQEPDGYLHTAYTLGGQQRWSNRYDHEGYSAGYFIEAALAHYRMSGKRDRRLLDAARRLADCWVRNIGPAPKKSWWDDHEELEQAMFRLARFVDATEGKGKGEPYGSLATFLLNSRKDGDEYNQSHVPLARQYEAVGHSVRAMYAYAGLADLAAGTSDKDTHSALKSLWDSIVNRKYYITGGMGSGETSEGFGKDFSLPNSAYSESCAGCGAVFFQHKMQLAYRESKYMDLLEDSLYNVVLGALDLQAQNFTYTNALDSSGRRYKWHVCPCCVGNIARTLLQLPTWAYATGQDALYVNLFFGGTATVGVVGGAKVSVTQVTDYPRTGKVRLTLLPSSRAKFALHLRVPCREVSALYKPTPSVEGLLKLTVNGKVMVPKIAAGYAVVDRLWKAGDQVELMLPLAVQRVKADPRIAADVGRVALRYGPLVFNFESVDQPVDGVIDPSATLVPEWRPDLLGGVLTIRGSFADKTPFVAIPNYARLNRGGRSVVWVRDR